MQIRPFLDTFFNVTLIDNGALENIGNRLMKPWRNEKSFNWIVINQNRYAPAIPLYGTLDKILAILPGLVATIFATCAYFALLLKSKKLAIASMCIYPTTMVLGVIIKLISWINRPVREKNFQYLQLKENEHKTQPPPYFFNRPDINSKINLEHRNINPQDRLSKLPLVLKQLVGEYLDTNGLLSMEFVSKTNLHDMRKSTQYLNRSLIKQLFPTTFLHKIGMDKVLQIMSQPSIKINPQLNKVTTNHLSWELSRRPYDLQFTDEVWHFDPAQMGNRSIRWGKGSNGTVFWVFSYKYHNASFAEINNRQIEGPYGMSVIYQKNKNDPNSLKVSPVVEKLQVDSRGDRYTPSFDMINCFVVNNNVLSIVDYIPRLINEQPCGVYEKDANGNVVEGQRTIRKPDGVHRMVELMPLPA